MWVGLLELLKRQFARKVWPQRKVPGCYVIDGNMPSWNGRYRLKCHNFSVNDT